jgi:hypothetical protein
MRLDMQQRRALSPNDYVFPDKAPGPGSYPIPDRGHAEAALRLAGRDGPEVEAAVRRAVCARYKIGCGQ